MLDEKREYQLYLTQGYGGLLRRDNLKNDLAGIRQVLTILARGFIELCGREGLSDLNSKHALCKEFLKCWVTGEHSTSTDAPKGIVAELEKAKKASLLKHLVDNEIKPKSLSKGGRSEILKYLNDKVELWENSMFFSLQKNSANEIYFKTVIADALHKGGLTDSVLIIKNGGQGYGIEGKDLSSQNLNTLLYIVGAVLQNAASGQKTALAKMAQISNLVNKPTCRKKKRDSAFASLQGFVDSDLFTYKGKPIVAKTSLAGGIVKLSVNEKWVSDYGVQLAQANVVVDRGYTALRDSDLSPNYFDDDL